MGLLGFAVLIVVAVVAGMAVQYLAKSGIRFEWIVVAASIVFGGYFASETFPGSGLLSAIKDWGPSVDGLVIVPAIIGALILTIVADLGMRRSPEIQPA